MMQIDTSSRINRAEIMDDFELQGDELEITLKDLENINKWLGGNKVTLQGVKELLKSYSAKGTVHIVDVGCGNGAMLREIAAWARSTEYELKLTGIDANEHAVNIAERSSEYYPEIGFKTQNIFSEEFKRQHYDIVLCTLTLHHFTDEEIANILNNFYEQARIGVVINDLHRSKQAYFLFTAFCRVFIKNKIAKEDGLTSILRGFKRKDLRKFAARIPSKNQKIRWKWAYRYQWIIKKQKTL